MCVLASEEFLLKEWPQSGHMMQFLSSSTNFFSELRIEGQVNMMTFSFLQTSIRYERQRLVRLTHSLTLKCFARIMSIAILNVVVAIFSEILKILISFKHAVV